MDSVTRILSALDPSDLHAPEQLVPLVYDELRRLAADRSGSWPWMKRWTWLGCSTRYLTM